MRCWHRHNKGGWCQRWQEGLKGPKRQRSLVLKVDGVAEVARVAGMAELPGAGMTSVNRVGAVSEM